MILQRFILILTLLISNHSFASGGGCEAQEVDMSDLDYLNPFIFFKSPDDQIKDVRIEDKRTSWEKFVDHYKFGRGGWEQITKLSKKKGEAEANFYKSRRALWAFFFLKAVLSMAAFQAVHVLRSETPVGVHTNWNLDSEKSRLHFASYMAMNPGAVASNMGFSIIDNVGERPHPQFSDVLIKGGRYEATHMSTVLGGHYSMGRYMTAGFAAGSLWGGRSVYRYYKKYKAFIETERKRREQELAAVCRKTLL